MSSGPRGLGSLLLLGLVFGCPRPEPGPGEPKSLVVWRHESGEPELSASLDALARFDADRPDVELEVHTLPQGTYTEAVTASALAGKLPCVLDVDQPTVPNFAWTGHLRALDDLIDPARLEPLMEGARSRYRGRLYAVGQFDVALALFAKESELEALGARRATLDAPYTPSELMEILQRAKARAPQRYPLDLSMVHRGEWLPYAFSPWLQSAGADLVDRTDYQRAEGFLNGPRAHAVIRWFQRLF